MIRKHFTTWSKICSYVLTGTGMLLLASCADDGFSDESFTSGNGVRNTQLTSPAADDIAIEASADGSKQVISWPVVYGAGGYQAVLTNLTDDKVVVDTIIDGLSFAAPREEDTNYKVTVQVLGNTNLGNTAGDVSEKLFNTFSESFAAIPEGDIYAYFQEHPLPEEPMGKELCYDLVPGGNYTLSGIVDFGGHQVTLRSTSKTNPANLIMEEGSTFTTFAGFSLKYMNIDASTLNHSIVTMSEEPNDSIKDLIGTKGWYFIMKPITLQGCVIRSLGTNLVSTNTTKYNLRSVNVSNCVVQMNEESTNTSAIVYIKAGYITNFTIKNSTVYAKSRIEKFFMQHGGRPKDISDTELRYVNITNCTLANIAWGKNFCDYHNGQKTYYYTVLNSIIYDCGKPNFVTGLNKGQSSANPTWNIDNNTYWRNGADASESQTGYTDNNKGQDTKLTTDPEIDPATEDFVPAAAQQEAGQGDPRWFTINN